MRLKLMKLALCALALAIAGMATGPAVVRADKAQQVSVQELTNQIGGGTGYINSARYASGTTAAPRAAADINVPAGPWWLITQITVPGVLSVPAGTTLQGVDIQFFVDSAGKPGSNYSGVISLPSGLINGNSVLNLGSIGLRPNRIYWVSVQARFSVYSGLAQWGWYTRSAVVIPNPGAQTGTTQTGCNVWNVPWDACGGGTVASEDELQYSMAGVFFTPSAFYYMPMISRN